MNERLVAREHVNDEQRRQFQKWGEQNHSPERWMLILTEELGEFSKECLRDKYGHEWSDSAITELIQVAAVSQSMLECALRNANAAV